MMTTSPLSDPPALELRGLNKSFGDTQAVRDFHLHVPRGSLYALLGPNGAGKTTTLRMVTGLLEPDSGDAFILGASVVSEPERAKTDMAYLPDDPMLYGKLKPLEYLEFVAGLWNMDARQAEASAQKLLEWLNLWDNRDDLTETFSRGMKQKLALAGALIHEPKLMVLDEPLTGLDAAAAKGVKDLLVNYVNEGNTVIFTTHIMEMAERLARRIGIINRGQLVEEGTLDELRSRSRNGSSTLEDVFLSLVDTTAGVAS